MKAVRGTELGIATIAHGFAGEAVGEVVLNKHAEVALVHWVFKFL